MEEEKEEDDNEEKEEDGEETVKRPGFSNNLKWFSFEWKPFTLNGFRDFKVKRQLGIVSPNRGDTVSEAGWLSCFGEDIFFNLSEMGLLGLSWNLKAESGLGRII